MNLKEFCKSKGTNINQIAEQSGIPPTTLYTISSGKTPIGNMGISMFIKVANALGCTTDELYDALTSDESPRYQDLTPEQSELVDIMNRITAQGQHELMMYARGIAASYPKNNQLREIEATA